MGKRIVFGLAAVLFLTSLYGCVALFAGAAGGAGTAAWFSGKLTETVDVPFDRTIAAGESALKSMDLEVTKKTRKDTIAQIIGKYSDGKTIWIDIRRLTEKSTQVSVRVGAVKPDKAAATKILSKIKVYL